MANVISVSLPRSVRYGFSEGILCLLAAGFGLLLSQGCSTVQRPSDINASAETTRRSAFQRTQRTAKGKPTVQVKLPQIGKASWYGREHQGKPTASGEKYDQRRFTAAHRSLPFGTKIKVTNLDNGKSAKVRINDRGPFEKNRIIDLSEAAAKALKMMKSDTATVRLDLSKDTESHPCCGFAYAAESDIKPQTVPDTNEY